MESGRELAERLVPWAERIATRFCRDRGLPSWQWEDARSCAYYGLAKAAANYDPQKGDFTVYARRTIIGAIIDDIRRMRGRRFRPEFVTPAPAYFRRSLGNPFNIVYLRELVERLSERGLERKVLWGLLAGYTTIELAERFAVSRKKIMKARREIRRKIH